MKRQNYALLLGGSLSLLAGILHIAIIIGGSPWYRYFGAGERLTSMAAHGSFVPGLLTAGVAFILFLWAGYAFSGAGFCSPWPFLNPVLIIISGVYLVRGLLLIPMAFFHLEALNGLMIWSSLVCLVIGLAYLIGTWKIKILQAIPEKGVNDSRLLQRARFCKDICPICRYARKKGKGFLFQLVRLERWFCPFCRAYEQVYGKPAYR